MACPASIVLVALGRAGLVNRLIEFPGSKKMLMRVKDYFGKAAVSCYFT